MSRILIPVDFSYPCHNAYRFGLHLADEMGLDVVLAHYYTGSIDPRAPLVITGDGSVRGSYLERLRQFAYADHVEPPTGVDISYETDVILSPSGAIVNRAAEPDIVFVVMATLSSERMFGKWLGSTSTTVSESCERPVFLIPPKVKYRPFNRMVVANNHETADPYPLWQLEGLADFYGGKVHFVHVERREPPATFRFMPWRLMEELVDEDPGVSYPFEIITVADDDISGGLIDYADEVHADLIVVFNRKRSRWSAMLRATLTQDLALRSNRPLLILHTDGKVITDPALAGESEERHS